MIPFIENNIKPSLRQETRVLTMPDGEPYPVTAFKLCWDAYDLILEYGFYKKDQLIRMAEALSEITGRSFEEQFFCMVAVAQRNIIERLNKDNTD
jgi:hypothetical protein